VCQWFLLLCTSILETSSILGQNTIRKNIDKNTTTPHNNPNTPYPVGKYIYLCRHYETIFLHTNNRNIMSNFKPPKAKNEPVLDYKPGSAERTAIQQKLAEMRATQIEAPMYIGGKMVTTGNLVAMRPPHDHAHILGHFHRGDASHVSMAIDAALVAKEKWMNVPWQHKAAIFLKAADLIAGKYRATINAATMLGQSKSVNQAEIDSACELTDFLRHNVQYVRNLLPTTSQFSWHLEQTRAASLRRFCICPHPV
jgi:1-pyrroline-5-carboxylate dehydrogenase